MGTLIRRRPHAVPIPSIALYAGLAYAISWATWIPLAMMAEKVVRGDAWPSHVPGLMGPMAAALLATWLLEGQPGIRDLLTRMTRWRVEARWWLVAFSPVAFFLVAIPIARMIDGAWPAWAAFDQMNGFPEIGVVGVWALVTLLNGFGEETGWRGFAVEHLQRRMAPFAATLVVAVIWAVWHTPVFFFVSGFEDYDPPMLAGFFVGMACGAVVLAWLYNRSGGSVLIVAIWHGTYNIVPGSAGAEGTVQVVVSALIMLQALVLVILDLRVLRRGERAVLGPRRHSL